MNVKLVEQIILESVDAGTSHFCVCKKVARRKERKVRAARIKVDRDYAVIRNQACWFKLIFKTL